MIDTQFMSAKEKELVLKQWKNFLRKLKASDFGNLRGSDYGYFPNDLNKPFTERLYKYLSSHFGFIAHYNRYGFLAERFGGFDKSVETLNQMRAQPSFDTDSADINTAIRQAIVPAGHPENVPIAL